MDDIVKYGLAGFGGVVIGAIIMSKLSAFAVTNMLAKAVCSTTAFGDLQAIHNRCPNVSPLDMENWIKNYKNW